MIHFYPFASMGEVSTSFLDERALVWCSVLIWPATKQGDAGKLQGY